MPHDVLILGGGVIGLATAYELAGRGRKVGIIERNPQAGHESSWAGAGIVPPAIEGATDAAAQAQLVQACRLHAEWAQRLLAETGIDNGYRRCGAVYTADNPAARAELERQIVDWREHGIAVRALDAASLDDVEPALVPAWHAGRISAACHLPGEAQVRNPRHVRALTAACLARGVEIETDAVVEDFAVEGDRVVAARTSRGLRSAAQFVLCGGAWSSGLAARWGVTLEVRPIRGQIVLLHPPQPVVRGIVNAGRRYLVARDDGRVLVGSTEEDVGFDKSNTDVAVDDLLAFAHALVPELAAAPVERTWAGLRPFASAGRPFIGRAPRWANAYIAAGHYRWGITLSPVTAVAIADLLTL